MVSEHILHIENSGQMHFTLYNSYEAQQLGNLPDNCPVDSTRYTSNLLTGYYSLSPPHSWDAYGDNPRILTHRCLLTIRVKPCGSW